ncbi:Fur family transcriptional regulator [Streptomyces sp. NPDC005727]|uniref:Fur family transcriptional regulator n=1 Tax=unclassified Streptomyces TaxID=2593676 RepID=UPI0033E743BF
MTRTATDLRESCREQLRARGVRCTSARLSVLQVLAEDGGHLGAAQIHRRISEAGGRLDVSTVYRTLERLAELGMVHQLAGTAQASYGLAVEPHHHVVCTGCGAVDQIPAPVVAEALQAAAGVTAFRPESLVLSGLCPGCQA